MEYQVIVGENLMDVQSSVRVRLVDGWEPFGGVSVAMAYDTNRDEPKYLKYHFAQAMVRYFKSNSEDK